MRVEVLGARRDRREDAHDARRHRHDAERNGRHARAGDVAVARRGERAHSGHARPLHARFCPTACRSSASRSAALGLLQIPPMDLGQVEVIKGVASALYGAGAMGGVVNLISRRPGDRAERELLVNRSTRGATDASRLSATPLSRALGLHRCSAAATGRSANDVERRRLGRPAGLLARRRAAARLLGRRRRPHVLRDRRRHLRGSRRRHACRRRRCRRRVRRTSEALDTRRVRCRRRRASSSSSGRYVVTARAAVARSATIISSARSLERDRHDTAFGEVAVRGSRGRHTLGRRRRRRARRLSVRATCRGSPTPSPCPACSCRTTSTLAPWLSLSRQRAAWTSTASTARSSARASRRCCVPARWTSRLSVGTGFFGADAADRRDRGGRLVAAGHSARRSKPSAGGARRST